MAEAPPRRAPRHRLLANGRQSAAAALGEAVRLAVMVAAAQLGAPLEHPEPWDLIIHAI